MNRLIQWIRPSFEDNEGKSSYRRFSAFYAICMDAYIIIGDKITNETMLWVHYSLLVYSLVMTGIVTVQNILDFKNGKNGTT